MYQVMRYSESDLNRVREFVDHLLANPGIKNEPLIIAEVLIMNFMNKNHSRLEETFKNPHFFPELEYSQVIELILADIYDRISASVLPLINNFIECSDLSFFNRLSESGVVAESHRKNKLHEFVIMLFRNSDVRYHMRPVINIFRYNAIERYISYAFSTKNFIYNELIRVCKIKLELNDYIKLIKTALLVRSAAHLKLNYSGDENAAGVKFADAATDKQSADEYSDSGAEYLSGMIPGIPFGIIRLAIRSNLPAELLESDETLPALIYIMSSMFRDYCHIEKPVRGAEPQEKSWLSAALKNYIYSGYDRRIVESLYLIAGENNW